MRYILPFLISTLITFSSGSLGQVTVTYDDMPSPGDTIRTSTTMVLDGLDYESTGENHTWDFSSLQPMFQQVDTFVSIFETPATYQVFFNNQFLYPEHKATIAKAFFEFDLIQGFEVQDTYQFYKGSDDDYREVGFGVRLTGIPIAIQYDQIDVIYDFPIEYGNVDSSFSGFEFALPNLGYASSERSRRNMVDGWGTLITPYGEFDVLRMKTLINQRDSVYIDTAGQGFPVNREITEYKWLGKESGLPLLKISEEGLLVQATYIDSVRTTFSDIEEPVAEAYRLTVYPNPCDDYLSVHYELKDLQDLSISIFTIYGHEVLRIELKNQAPGLYNRIININAEGISPGVYLLHFSTSQIRKVRRIVVR